MKTVRRVTGALAASALAFTPVAAFAQVVNPGFETPAVAAGGTTVFSGGSNVGGWAVVGTQVMLVSTTYTEQNGVPSGTLLFNAHSGLASMDLTGSGNNGLTAGVQQSLATTLGQNYSLSFWVGRAAGNSFYNIASTVDLSVNGGSRINFTNSNTTANQVNWQQFSYNFTATGASTLVTFFNGTDSPNNNYVGLDDVIFSGAVTTVTPEPSSVLLMAAGLLSVAGVVRRRRGTKAM